MWGIIEATWKLIMRLPLTLQIFIVSLCGGILGAFLASLQTAFDLLTALISGAIIFLTIFITLMVLRFQKKIDKGFWFGGRNK